MKRLLVVLIIISSISLVSCKEPTNEEVFYEIQKTLNHMESYSCLTSISVTGNKSTKTYELKQIFKKPDKYIIEVVSPEDSKGCKMLYNGNQIWLSHPKIEQSETIKDYTTDFSNKDLFLGYFLRNFITIENSSLSSDIIEGKEYLVLATELPGNNRYRNSEKLWINKNDFIPYKMEILNIEQEVTTRIFFDNFKYDVKINDESFTVSRY